MNDYISNIRQKALRSRQNKELFIIGFTILVGVVVWLTLGLLQVFKDVTGLSAFDESVVTLVAGVNRTWTLPITDAVVISIILSVSFSLLFKFIMPRLSFWSYLVGFGGFSIAILTLAVLFS